MKFSLCVAILLHSEFSLYREIFTAAKISFAFGALYIFVFYDILLLLLLLLLLYTRVYFYFYFIFLKKKLSLKNFVF